MASRFIWASVIILVIVVGLAVALLTGTRGGAPSTATTTPSTTTAVQPTTTTEVQTSTITTTTAQQQGGVTLRVLTRYPGDIQKKAKEEFLKSDVAKKYGITDIEFLHLEPATWVPTIKNMAGTDQAIDVAAGGSVTLFDELYQAGVLAPLDGMNDVLSQIPDTFAGSPMKRFGSDGKVYWVAIAVSTYGFTVNHEVRQMYGLPVPKSWRDLGSPEFGKPLIDFGKPAVGVGDPTASTSNSRMYEIILQRYGWEEGWKIITGMAANSIVYPESGVVRDRVIIGEVAVGLTIDYYGYTAHIKNPACEFIAPGGEDIVSASPIALVSTSRHPEAAKAFIIWWMTDGQKVWLDTNINRVPVNPNVWNTPEGQQRQDLKKVYEELSKPSGFQFDDDLALKYEEAMRRYFKAVLIDQQGKLRQVWTTLLKLYYSGKITRAQFDEYWAKLSAPLTYKDPLTGELRTFTQDDAIRVTSIFRENRQAMSQYETAWSQAAEQRYNQILQELQNIKG